MSVIIWRFFDRIWIIAMPRLDSALARLDSTNATQSINFCSALVFSLFLSPSSSFSVLPLNPTRLGIQKISFIIISFPSSFFLSFFHHFSNQFLFDFFFHPSRWLGTTTNSLFIIFVRFRSASASARRRFDDNVPFHSIPSSISFASILFRPSRVVPSCSNIDFMFEIIFSCG